MNFITFIAASVLLHFVNSEEFTYDNVEEWSTVFPEHCSGDRQSPIEIVTKDVKYMSFQELSLSGYDATTGVNLSLINNGHALNLVMQGSYQLSGGNLPGDYSALQLHFHWGSDSSKGSEHRIDGNHHAGEMHVVHLHNNFTEFAQGLDSGEGLAVLGFFIEVGETDNPAFQEVVDAIEHDTNVQHQVDGGHKFETAFSVQDLFPSNMKDFFRYYGSLTIPNCYESVVWTLFEDTIKLSESQLNSFRKIRDVENHTVSNNFRNPMALNGRVIQSSFIISSCNLVMPSLLTMFTSYILYRTF